MDNMKKQSAIDEVCKICDVMAEVDIYDQSSVRHTFVAIYDLLEQFKSEEGSDMVFRCPNGADFKCYCCGEQLEIPSKHMAGSTVCCHLGHEWRPGAISDDVNNDSMVECEQAIGALKIFECSTCGTSMQIPNGYKPGDDVRCNFHHHNTPINNLDMSQIINDNGMDKHETKTHKLFKCPLCFERLEIPREIKPGTALICRLGHQCLT